MLSCKNTARVLAVLGLVGVTGCADFRGQRLDGVGRANPRAAAQLAQAKGPPEPLFIPDPPTARGKALPETVKQATFVSAAQPTVLPVASAVPEAAPSAAPAGNPLRLLHQQAAERYAALDSYIMRLKRREVVNGQSRPEEVMLVKFRREPWSVYFKWLGPEAKGREVVFVKGRYKNNIHTLTAAGDIPLLGPGTRFEISPDSSMVRSKSRYPITEAGLGALIRRYGSLVDALEKGDARQGTARHMGKLKRPEFETWVEAVVQAVPPKSDPLLPKGGQRWWFFDPTLHLPVLVIAQDETAREVEYYCHDHFQFPVRLDDDDFNPDKLWKKAS